MTLCKYIVICISLALSLHAETKFLLLCGPSGIGKSTLIRKLQKMDDRFIYIKPYTTRALRKNETDKIHRKASEILQMNEEKQLIALNYFYGNYYATPLQPVIEAFDQNFFPILDWPIEKMDLMREMFGEKTVCFYLYVNDLGELETRLGLDNRDPNGKRFAAGKKELENFFKGDYDKQIDKSFLQLDLQETAEQIYQSYLESL